MAQLRLSGSDEVLRRMKVRSGHGQGTPCHVATPMHTFYSIMEKFAFSTL